MGKGSCSLTGGREWDGKVGIRLTDGTARESTASWRNGIMVRVGSRSGNHSGT